MKEMRKKMMFFLFFIPVIYKIKMYQIKIFSKLKILFQEKKKMTITISNFYVSIFFSVAKTKRDVQDDQK